MRHHISWTKTRPTTASLAVSVGLSSEPLHPVVQGLIKPNPACFGQQNQAPGCSLDQAPTPGNGNEQNFHEGGASGFLAGLAALAQARLQQWRALSAVVLFSAIDL